MKRWPVVVALLATFALMWATWGCAIERNFNTWFDRQGYTIIHGPVPCDQFPTNCGGSGQADIVNRRIYIDDPRLDSFQQWQNLIDPTVDVKKMQLLHEKGHVADVAAGFIEGNNPVGYERAAQCIMQLVSGKVWVPHGLDGNVYWQCPEGELARTRWILTSKGII